MHSLLASLPRYWQSTVHASQLKNCTSPSPQKPGRTRQHVYVQRSKRSCDLWHFHRQRRPQGHHVRRPGGDSGKWLSLAVPLPSLATCCMALFVTVQLLAFQTTIPQILVGTPAKLAMCAKDSGGLNLDAVRLLVVDEFDACIEEAPDAVDYLLTVRFHPRFPVLSILGYALLFFPPSSPGVHIRTPLFSLHIISSRFSPRRMR